jgi:hypothetical protein
MIFQKEMNKFSKEILDKESFAMFIGCEVKTPNGIGFLRAVDLNSSVSLTIDIPNHGREYESASDVKPILRHLSSLNEQEKLIRDSLAIMVFHTDGSRGYVDTATSFMFLIALKVDIFGWIEKGLALNLNHHGDNKG